MTKHDSTLASRFKCHLLSFSLCFYNCISPCHVMSVTLRAELLAYATFTAWCVRVQQPDLKPWDRESDRETHEHT